MIRNHTCTFTKKQNVFLVKFLPALPESTNISDLSIPSNSPPPGWLLLLLLQPILSSIYPHLCIIVLWESTFDWLSTGPMRMKLGGMLPWQYHGPVEDTVVHLTTAEGSQYQVAGVEQHWQPFLSPDWQNRRLFPWQGNYSGQSVSVKLFYSTSWPTLTHSIATLWMKKLRKIMDACRI